MAKTTYIGLGVALGSAVGVAVGLAIGNLAVGLAVGVGLGVAIGAGLDARSARQNRASDNQGARVPVFDDRPKAQPGGKGRRDRDGGSPVVFGDTGKSGGRADDSGSDADGGDGGGGD